MSATPGTEVSTAFEILGAGAGVVMTKTLRLSFSRIPLE